MLPESRFAAGVGVCLLMLGLGPVVEAQVSAVSVQSPDSSDRVALVVLGPDGSSARSAFETFVSVDADMHLTSPPPEPPADATVLVHIDTNVPLVTVWRRLDGVVLERRFDGPEDGYALAVVASELLEVARTGGDPASVGATVVVEASPLEPEGVAETEVVDPSEEPAESHAEEAGAKGGWAVEGTVGLGVEGWFSADADPWIVQPTLFAEALVGPAEESWRVGGGLIASAFGSYALAGGGFSGSYARHDVGARLSVGGDLGPLRTRLLVHVRVGGALVTGEARPQADEDDDRSASRPGWLAGVSLDLRQPIVEGLEIFIEVGADGVPAPVRFTALGTTLVREPTLRLSGRLGLAWRFR